MKPIHFVLNGVSKETKVGSLTALAITVLILGYNYMVGRDNPFKGSRDFYVLYDSTQGVAESTPLMYNGFRIGQLRKLRLDEKNHKIVATLEVYSNMGIPANSRVKIDADILGGMKLKLIPGDSKRMAASGDTLLPQYAKDVMSLVNEKIAPIAARADSLLANLNALIQRASVQQTFDRLPTLVTSVSQTLDELRKTIENIRPGITTSVENLAAFSRNLDAYGKTIETGLKSFEKFAAQLDSVQLVRIMASLEATVNSMSGLIADIQSGKGTLGLLAKDETLYKNLVQTNLSLQCLLNDIKDYPQKYLPLPWGKKQRRKATEKSNNTNNCFPKDSAS